MTVRSNEQSKAEILDLYLDWMAGSACIPLPHYTLIHPRRAQRFALFRVSHVASAEVKKRCTMADRAGLEMSDDDDSRGGMSLYGVVINHT